MTWLLESILNVEEKIKQMVALEASIRTCQFCTMTQYTQRICISTTVFQLERKRLEKAALSLFTARTTTAQDTSESPTVWLQFLTWYGKRFARFWNCIQFQTSSMSHLNRVSLRSSKTVPKHSLVLPIESIANSSQRTNIGWK
jgi:hypothetical protein